LLIQRKKPLLTAGKVEVTAIKLQHAELTFHPAPLQPFGFCHALVFGAAHFFRWLAFLQTYYHYLGHLLAQLLPQLQNNLFDLGQVRLRGLFSHAMS
jgi:hypothetical protein